MCTLNVQWSVTSFALHYNSMALNGSLPSNIQRLSQIRFQNLGYFQILGLARHGNGK